MKLTILIALMLIAMNITGIILGIEIGKRVLRNEAVAFGYAEYYLTNDTRSFRWLCDSPAVDIE